MALPTQYTALIETATDALNLGLEHVDTLSPRGVAALVVVMTLLASSGHPRTWQFHRIHDALMLAVQYASPDGYPRETRADVETSVHESGDIQNTW